jgi:hypothetical protein
MKCFMLTKMIEFLIEYSKLMFNTILAILLIISIFFSIIGPLFLCLIYSPYFFLLYIATVPYIVLLFKKLNE